MKQLTNSVIPLTFLDEYDDPVLSMNTVQTKQGLGFMLKNAILLCSLMMLWFFSDAALAEAKQANNASDIELETSFSSLWLESQDGSKKIASEALSTEINMSVSGPILRAIVKQTFHNPTQVWLEGTYTFPLPEQATVDQLRMVIGERVVVGEIKEKHAAKKTYEIARSKGQRTSLLNHHRTNIFTSSVANIGPNESITVEFEYQQIVDFRDHQYTLRFPMVSTPQYTPPRTRLEKDFVKPVNIVRSASDKLGNPVSIHLDLKPGFPIDNPSSTSHPISVKPINDTHYKVDLKGTSALSNRDFVLSWQIKPFSKPMVSILREDIKGESYGFMMIMPPQIPLDTVKRTPRELIWVLDVSGSMQGESIEQARSAMLKALSALNPEDSFNIICFNTRAWKLFPHSRIGTEDNLNLAREKILNLEANGGTDMRPALSLALNQRKHSEQLRQVIFVTDGAVSNEEELLNFIQTELNNTRLFTIGIGSAPNSYFMRQAALAGRGSFTYISQPSEVSLKIDQLLRKIKSPALTDLGFDINNPMASVLPTTLPDVYRGEPVYVSFKAEHFPSYAELTGTLNGTPSNLKLPLDNTFQHKGVAVEWARRKLSELSDSYQKANNEMKKNLKLETLDIALAHHQVSRFTSLVAVDQFQARAGGLLKHQKIPANVPKGWVNHQTRSSQGIRLAQTATDLPFNLWLGSSLLTFSCLLFTVYCLYMRRTT